MTVEGAREVIAQRLDTGRPSLCAVALVAGLGLVTAEGRAQEHQEAHDSAAPESAPEGGHEAQEAAGEHGEAAETFAGHHVHTQRKNGLALFLGETLVTAEDQAFFTLGLEYERLLADRWALQVVGEYVRDFDALVVVVPVGFRLAGTLWAVAGPGLESEARRTGLEAEPHEDVHGTSPDDEHSTEPHDEGEGPFFLWRFGLVYGIHLGESGRFGLFPSFSLDVVREHGEWQKAWVLGVGVSYHF